MAAAVKARIAEIVLAAEKKRARPGAHEAPSARDPAIAGRFTLRTDQLGTLAAVRAAIDEFGGALLADPPGTGKTVIALALAHALGPSPARVRVLAPSNLRAQWTDAAARAAVAIEFVSLESLSRGPSPGAADLVIVDEAHHLRTPSTRRYAHAAAICMAARVLLLTATPVVNRTADRHSVLSLFLGSRAQRLTSGELGRCIVRRRGNTAGRPAVRRLAPIDAHTVLDGLGEALRSLPPPLPLMGGTAATALIGMTLAMAWQSSLAALDAALRRRLQRGGAIADVLRAGRMPSRESLRHWALHDDATQLALADLVDARPAPEPTVRAMLDTLDRHLTAVESIRRRIRPVRDEDATRRASALRDLLRAHPTQRIVLFARHAETVRALHAALRGEPGVVAIIGARVRAAAGRWTREEVLRAIGPRARPLVADDARAIRLVLSTDALAEGVEMQGIGIIVHADLPWTPARLEQRLGRVVRVGSGAREVLEGRFTAPQGARALVRLGARLARKSRLRDSAVRDGDARGGILAILERWRQHTGSHAPAARGTDEQRPLEAVVSAECDGFVAVTTERGAPWPLCGTHDGTRWIVSSTPRSVLVLLRLADRARSAEAGSASVLTSRRVRRLIARVLARRAAMRLGAPNAASTSLVRRARARFARLLERAPALARPALAGRQHELLRALDGPIGVALEEKVVDLLRNEPDDAAFAHALGALLRHRVGVEDHELGLGDADRSARTTPLLLLRRASAPPATPAGAPTSASPGTAAPR